MQIMLSLGLFLTVTSQLADIGPAPPIRLIDQSGQPFDLASMQGKVVVISFIFTTCNGSCPATTATLYQTQEAFKKAGIWGGKVAFISISLDPERDSPEVLTRYARSYGADLDHWKFLTGTNDQVQRVLKSWDMWAKLGPGGVLDHPSRIFLIDRRGRQREIYNLEFLKPTAILHDVRMLMKEMPEIPS